MAEKKKTNVAAEQLTAHQETEDKLTSADFLRTLEEFSEKAKKNQNTLAPDDIQSITSNFSLDDGQVESVEKYFEAEGIDILDTNDVEVHDDDLLPIDDDEMNDASQDELRLIETEESETQLVDDGTYTVTDDPVRMYLKEIGRVKLLSSEEEIALAIRIEDGFIAGRLLEGPFASDEDLTVTPEMLDDIEEIREIRDEKVERFDGLVREALEKLAYDGKEAKKELTEANLRLVVSIAKKYIGHGLTFLDLIQEGNIGLMKAVDKFDYRKGFKFSTYATWWIRQAITRAVADQARTIRIPVHMVEQINRYAKTVKSLTLEYGREPTDKELAQQMDVSVEKVNELRQYMAEPMSLDTPVGDEEDTQLGDFIGDDKAVNPADAASFSNLRVQIEEAMSSLTDREQQVLRLRFGLDDGKARTLEEVGTEFGVTRERIRQIESKALRKLRHPNRSRKLKDFME